MRKKNESLWEMNSEQMFTKSIMFAVVHEDDSYWHNDALLRMQKKRTTQCNYSVTITIADEISIKLILENTREILWYKSHVDLSWIDGLRKNCKTATYINK